MTNLTRVLNSLIDKNHGSHKKFADACGLDRSTISLLMGGRECSRDLLPLICQHISADPSERYEVLFAHLLDEAEASGLDIKSLVIRRAGEVTLGELKIDDTLRRDLALLGEEASKHRDARDVLKSMADMIARSREHESATTLVETPGVTGKKRKAKPIEVDLGATKPSQAQVKKTG